MSTPCSRTGVLLIDLAHGTGGAESRLLDTARGLLVKGRAVRAVCLAGSPLADALGAAGVPTLTVARSKWDPRLVLALRRLLAEHDEWVVDAHNAQSQLALHLASARSPHSGRFFATIHSEYRKSERRPLGLSVHEWVLRRTIRSGWGLIAVTPSVRLNLEALGAQPDDIKVIFSGVGSLRRGNARSATQVREALGLCPDDFVVVGAGRLVKVKNFELAIRAILLLHRSLPGARLVLVGDGPEQPHLERLAGRLGGPRGLVRFTGHRDDVPDLFAAADVVVITSMTEGLPYVLLEAVAAGAPVVSTSVGAIPELFGDGAVALLPTGAERRPGGAALLATELLALARQPARRRHLADRAAVVQQLLLTLTAMIESTILSYGKRPTADPDPALSVMASTA